MTIPKGNLAVALIWAYIVAWILSALLHMSDPDVGGIGALFHGSTLTSISALAVALMIPTAACQILWRMRKHKEMFAVLFVASLVVGTIVGVWGSSGDVLPRILGGFVLMIVVILIGCLPMWVGKSRESE